MVGQDDNENRWEGPNGRTIQATRDSQVTAEFDAVFDLLRVARRRYLLYYLFGMEDVVTTFEEAVEAVRAYEGAGTESDELPSRKSIRVDLFHSQFPRLEDAGIIEFDQRDGMVRFHGSVPLEEWLEHAKYLELE